MKPKQFKDAQAPGDFILAYLSFTRYEQDITYNLGFGGLIQRPY